jgi:DNA-binding response OmpR family regulator
MTDRKNILLVEDDKNLAFVVKDNLLDAGYDVIHVSDGDEAIKRFLEDRVDLVLLDIMLPRQDGFSVAETIREKDKQTPIIFLTAKDFKEDRIKGFQLGADDYVTKPFELEELLLRIEAVLRRTSDDEIDHETRFRFGLFEFEPASLSLWTKKARFTMTKKEAALLVELVRNEDRVVERPELLKKVWGKDGYFVGRSMDVYMTKIRKYLKEDPSIEIVNIHGVGFKLTVGKDKPA